MNVYHGRVNNIPLETVEALFKRNLFQKQLKKHSKITMCVLVSQINVMEFSQNIFFNSVPKRGSILYFDAAYCRPLVASFKSELRLPHGLPPHAPPPSRRRNVGGRQEAAAGGGDLFFLSFERETFSALWKF